MGALTGTLSSPCATPVLVVVLSLVAFQRKVLWASARDPEARAAMLAWRESRSLALNAPAKLSLLEEIFARHRDERVLVFSEYNALVGEVSERFAIPQYHRETAVEAWKDPLAYKGDSGFGFVQPPLRGE